MGKKKAAWRKTIDSVEIQKTLEDQGRAKELAKQQASIVDSELFKVATKAAGVRAKRDKLRGDRFKEKEYLTRSPYEEVLVKRMIEKAEKQASLPPPNPPRRKKSEEEELENLDLWADEKSNLQTSLKMGKFRDFTKKTIVKVNPVVLPLAGQSYNPNAKDHKEVIQRVVDEELKDLREVQRQLKTLKPYLFSQDCATQSGGGATIREGLFNSKNDDNKSSSSSDSEEGGSSEEAKGGAVKPVSRLNKLTKTERN
jgi:hypothetical protein